MAKKKKKKVAKKKRAKSPRKPKLTAKYSDQMVSRVRQVIMAAQTIKADGTLDLGLVAKIMGISLATFGRWRDPANKRYYHKDFAAAVVDAAEKMIEDIDLNKAKRAMINRALPYTKKKVIRELREVGPPRPALSKLNQKELRTVASDFGIEHTIKTTIEELKELILDHIRENTSDQLVITKVEEEETMGETAAGRVVTSNLGSKDKRWVTDRSEVDVTGKSLADICALMAGKKAG